MFRKVANEAIYPFYLLHQPVILIVGFLLIKMEMPDFTRFILLTISSFGITCALYWFVVQALQHHQSDIRNEARRPQAGICHGREEPGSNSPVI